MRQWRHANCQHVGFSGERCDLHGGGQQEMKRSASSTEFCKTSVCTPGAHSPPNAATYAPPIRAERTYRVWCCWAPGIRTRLPPPSCASITNNQAASPDTYRPNRATTFAAYASVALHIGSLGLRGARSARSLWKGGLLARLVLTPPPYNSTANANRTGLGNA